MESPVGQGFFLSLLRLFLANRIPRYLVIRLVSFPHAEAPSLDVREGQLLTSPPTMQGLAEALPHAQDCVWDHASSLCLNSFH